LPKLNFHGPIGTPLWFYWGVPNSSEKLVMG
jgi:hypothetical protein